MSAQHVALQLANAIHCGDDRCRCSGNLAAVELRRQHQMNAELLDALQYIAIADYRQWDAPLNNAKAFHDWAKSRASASIAKATEVQK